MPPRLPSRSRRYLPLGTLLATGGPFLLYILLILAHPQPPSLGDFGDLIYQGVLLRNHMLGIADPTHLVKHYPVPNGAVTLGIALFAIVFPWTLAAKLYLCTQLALSFVVLYHFLRTRIQAGHILATNLLGCIAPAAIFLNLNFWYGFLNFELGVCWAILFASLLLRAQSPQHSYPKWLFGLLLLLGFFSHMVPFAFMGLMLLTYAASRRQWRLLWQLLPSALASLWYLAGRFLLSANADGQAGMVSAVRQFSLAFWAFKINSFLKSFGWVNLGTRAGSATLALLGEPAFVALFLLNALLCGLLAWCLLHATRASLRRSPHPLDISPAPAVTPDRTPDHNQQHRFLWLAVLVALPVYLLAPAAALGISDPGSRVLEVALAVGLLLCPSSRALRAAAVCATLQALVALLLFPRAAYTISPVQASAAHLPSAVLHFAHVPNHDKDEYLRALHAGDLDLEVFPTSLLLNAPAARPPLAQEQ